MKRVIPILLVLCSTTAHAQSGKDLAYYCTGEASGGISYDKTQNRWTGTRFRPREAFVLRLQFLISKVEKLYSEKEESITHYRVTVTDKGTNNPHSCFIKNSPDSVIKVGVQVWFSCTSGLMDYDFNLTKGRYLSVYPVGFVNGFDNDDDTPSINGGFCTQIE